MSAKASTGSGAPIGRPIARQTLRCALVLSGAGAAGGRPAQSGGAAVNSTRRTAALAVADSELTMPRARTPPVRLVPIPCAGVNAVPAGQPPRIATGGSRRARRSSSASGRRSGRGLDARRRPGHLPCYHRIRIVRATKSESDTYCRHMSTSAATAMLTVKNKRKQRNHR